MTSAITPTRKDDYPEWYQQVIKAADLAEVSPVRGCMVIKPWGYGIWEKIQKDLDKRIKATGHENAYFPLFIPLSYLEKEASHVEGFAKECAVVTHHRLEEKNGKLVPTGELEEPLIVRPTSETIIGESFAKWVRSYRDLPLLINQWANVVRWEMRTRLFLRTAEFLWQEGHTAHATKEEALEETKLMLKVYQECMEEALGLSVLVGEKPSFERFPGAEVTLCCEAMMQDRKALQAGTSHYLGQNFAKASNIKFVTESGNEEFAHTTSWGVSTRLVGGVIMTHGDDDGLRLPPRIAPKQVVIIPVIPKPENQQSVLEYAEKVKLALSEETFNDEKIEVFIDSRDMRGGDKNWQWVKKGVPVRVEVGPRDVSENKVVLYRRDKEPKEKSFMTLNEAKGSLTSILNQIQANFQADARNLRETYTRTDITTFGQLSEFFTPKNSEKPEIHGGFVLAHFHDSALVPEKLKELKLTVRCKPLEQEESEGICIVTGQKTKSRAIFAKAY